MTQELTEWDKRQVVNARHRALILQILNANPNGLTTQQIVDAEMEYYGYHFLTDNRLRELRKRGYVQSFPQEGKPQLWKLKEEQNNEPVKNES